MTGTAMTEQEEFYKIYGLEVVAIPTHRPMVRDGRRRPRVPHENAKFNALIDEVAEMQEAGRPVLVGTVSVEKSEVLSTMLKRRGVKHEVLNAKFHEKEAPIVAQAGRSRRRDHRHEHGRPRHGHPAGRQPAGPRVEKLHQQGINPAEAEARSTRRAREAKADAAEHERSSRRAACTSSAPSATTRAASTTSCAAAPAARATPGRRASTCPSRTRS